MSTRTNRWLSLVLVLLFAGLALPAQAAGAWDTVGSAGFTTGAADNIKLVMDDSGTPYVAYRDVSDYSARVMKYSGAAWVTLGTAGSVTGSLLGSPPREISLALDSSGAPYLAYTDAVNGSKVTVKRYDGSSWVTVGSAGLSGGAADNISLAVTSDGTPYVAYNDAFFDSDLMVKRYNGILWEGAGLSFVQDADNISLAMDGNDILYAAYRQVSLSTSTVFVKRYDGSTWDSLGFPTWEATMVDDISLALDAAGTPHVAYRDISDPLFLKDKVMRYDGSLWDELGMGYFSPGQADTLSLAVAGDGTPYVAFRDLANGEKVTVMKCDATPPAITFSVLSGPQATSGESTYVTSATTLRVSVTDANPVGAWAFTVTAPDSSQSSTSLPFGNHDLTLNSGDGSYTLAVFATDGAGNNASGSQIYIVDNTPPDTGISSGPAALTNSSTASFSFTSTETGSTFECSLDGADFSACNNPQDFDTTADGSHTLQVRAIDVLGNTDASPASHNWTVDLTAPETTITSQPSDLTNDTSASLGFTSSEPDSTFQCSLDGAAYIACTSPQTYIGLGLGSHTFAVYATDMAGNSDASPATASWTIEQAYTFIGFLPPIDNPPTVNAGRAGRTYPVKWQLTDATGAYVGDLSTVDSIIVLSVACGQYNGDPLDALEAATTGATSLRYDSTANQYIYNWQTPLVSGCYTLVLTLDSGQVQTAYFSLKK